MQTHPFSVALNADKEITAEKLMALYASEPWWPERCQEDIEYILQNYISVGAWEGGRLVGFARVVSDGKFRAYIEDVLVLKDYRSRGIGKLLMSEILVSVKDIHVVTLFCQKKLSGYYTELGFKEFSKQVVMHMRNVR